MTMSRFDLEKFMESISGSDERAQLVAIARTAEAAERYEDMCSFMKQIVTNLHTSGDTLTIEERNLLSVAYKNVIGTRRASWRTLHAMDETNTSATDLKLAKVYKSKVEDELEKVCKEVLDMLENKLVNDDNQGEANVFFLKMTGDYYRYLAESLPEKNFKQDAAEFYEKAYQQAEVQLEPTHPIRLGLALNYSVCHYEILKNKPEACKLAKKAFDEAISKLDKLDDVDYKDSTLIMQLLRDNLTLWTSSPDNDDNVQVEDLSDEEN